ncbi:MAG: ParB/RepB/Spo0J family partition protein [Candidatus Ventricola sp.]
MRRRAAAQAEDGLSVIRVSIDDVYGAMIPGRAQQDEALAALAGSIARHGLLQPIVVRHNAQAGRYQLVCGARRLAACRLLGRREIDALLLRADGAEAAACFFEEHLTHIPPHFLDEADTLERLGAQQVAACCAIGTGAIARRHRMLALSQQTRQLLRGHALTLEQAEPLADVPDPDRQLEAASIIAERQLTSIQAQRLVYGVQRRAAERTESAPCRRRAVREAMTEATALAERLRRRGVDAGLSVLSQEGGLCIQIMLRCKKSTEPAGNGDMGENSSNGAAVPCEEGRRAPRRQREKRRI